MQHASLVQAQIWLIVLGRDREFFESTILTQSWQCYMTTPNNDPNTDLSTIISASERLGPTANLKLFWGTSGELLGKMHQNAGGRAVRLYLSFRKSRTRVETSAWSYWNYWCWKEHDGMRDDFLIHPPLYPTNIVWWLYICKHPSSLEQDRQWAKRILVVFDQTEYS